MTLPNGATRVDRYPFGTLPDGRPVQLYVLAHDSGVTLRAMTYGAIITSLTVPDHDGYTGDVVLGHSSLTPYVTDDAYLGAAVGRHANRIANGRFTVDGRVYQLATNDGANHLHGGIGGFHKRIWNAQEIENADHTGVMFSYTREDGEEHYPGTLHATVSYLFEATGRITVHYTATSTSTTIVNLTQHSYFNLAGGGTIVDHELVLHADAFTPVGPGLIPIGALQHVDDTPFDFREAMPVRRHLHDDHEQLHLARGYDHNWVVRRSRPGLVPAAVLTERSTGRRLEIHTTEPGIQFYSGNFLDGTVVGRNRHVFVPHAGLCLETQHFPDAPNQPAFPSTTIHAGESLISTTTWQFSTI